MAYLHGKFVWFEHASQDVANARRFYGELFGWHSEGRDMGGGLTYHLITNGNDGIGGFRTAMPGQPAHWLSYLSVADVDATAALASAAGGKVLLPPTDYPPVGRGACLADPTGAVFSIWKDSEGDRPDREPAAAGDWCWNELLTPDPERALAFYRQVFGYHDQVMDLAEAGEYHLLKQDGRPRAGLMLTPRPEVPAHWLPYVATNEADVTATRAGRLGAQVLAAPGDVPGVGRFAVFLDPLGAAFAVFRSSSEA